MRMGSLLPYGGKGTVREGAFGITEHNYINCSNDSQKHSIYVSG